MGIDASTWTSTMHQLVGKQLVDVAPYELDLNYDYWTYRTCVPERPLFIPRSSFTLAQMISWAL